MNLNNFFSTEQANVCQALSCVMVKQGFIYLFGVTFSARKGHNSSSLSIIVLSVKKINRSLGE